MRLRPPQDPVRITFDGESLVAERGEPICTALVAAGHLMIARSPKFHRPRGPSCLRGACDGCLARVDEIPNVMTCMTPADKGTTVVTQNRLGPRGADLLRMADWFFPEGMNHHELFAGVPGIQNVMQAFARRVAGLGKLPGPSLGSSGSSGSSRAATAPRKARRRAADALVVGAGPSGMAVAMQLASAGRTVEVVDDQLTSGGGVLALAEDDARAFAEIRAPFMDFVDRRAIRLRSRTTAAGIFGRDLLVVGPEGAEVVEATSLVLACGAHDGVLAFEGNDVPGVMSARAAGFFLAQGVLVGKRIAVVIAARGGPFGASFAKAVEKAVADLPERARPSVVVVRGEPIHVRGASRVKAVVVKGSRGEEEVAADAVLVDAERAPAYELAEQAGADLVHEPRGYVVRTDAGRIADGIFAVGEMVGTPFEAQAILDDAARAAASASAG